MTARHKKKIQTHSATESSVSQPSIEAKRHEREREPWVGLTISIVIFFVLATLKWKAEQTDFGKLVQQMTYDLLQLQLSPTLSAKDLPVVVLDISRIPMVQAQGLQPGLITKRAPLQGIVDSLANLPDGPPSAIGLDVDFSPDRQGYADLGDDELFDHFLNLEDKDKKKIPIRVGVNSSLALGPQRWLNDPKYFDLASCVVVPNPDPGQSTRYMVEWLDVNYSKSPYEGITAHCPSLGVALVKATIPDDRSWLKLFAETTNQKIEGPLSSPRFLVDYSPLDRLLLSSSPQEPNIHDPEPEIDNSADAAKFVAEMDKNYKLSQKIVLLGRTKNTTDTFTVPGRPEKPYAGVFLHACAAYTISTRPIYFLTKTGSAVFDILLPVVIFVAVFWFRLRRLKKSEEDFIDDGFPELLSFIVTLVLVIGAISFVRWKHLMWDDFILIAAVLIVTPPLERATGEILSLLSASWRSLRHVSSSSPRSH